MAAIKIIFKVMIHVIIEYLAVILENLWLKEWEFALKQEKDGGGGTASGWFEWFPFML